MTTESDIIKALVQDTEQGKIAWSVVNEGWSAGYRGCGYTCYDADEPCQKLTISLLHNGWRQTEQLTGKSVLDLVEMLRKQYTKTDLTREEVLRLALDKLTS